MIKKFLFVAIALLLVAGTAQANMIAVTKAISINFSEQTGATRLGPTVAAGVDDYTNWNNVFLRNSVTYPLPSANIIGNPTTAFLYNDGTAATGFQITGYVSVGANDWGNPGQTPLVTVDAGDKTLWSDGTRFYNPGAYNQIKLAGLSAIFPNGYTVRSYQDFYSGNLSNGATIVSTDLTVFGTSNTGAAGTYATTAWSLNNKNAFDGNFLTNGHYVSVTPTSIANSIVITEKTTSGAAFAQATWIGIQIVGTVYEPEPVAEPAGLGLIGLALLSLRKRRS